VETVPPLAIVAVRAWVTSLLGIGVLLYSRVSEEVVHDEPDEHQKEEQYQKVDCHQ
jgi:hypothetical protein